MFDNIYVPNKLDNKKIKDICFDLHYVREYYQRDQLKIYDCSNTTVFKIDLQNSMRIYINEDMTCDICTWGPGLQSTLFLKEMLFEWVKM